MFVYAGIDEAGYGPLLGPLTLARSVFVLPEVPPVVYPAGIDLWKHLSKIVARKPCRRGRIAINDSKKLHQSGEGLAGIRHLEMGALLFSRLAGCPGADLDQWLTALGVNSHREMKLPWYALTDARPWSLMPACCTGAELAVARNMLGMGLQAAGVQAGDAGLSVVFEDQFNAMARTTRSKAAVSFTFVTQHLLAIWTRFGSCHPRVAVDRQSGRAHYRELLALAFPQARIVILDENEDCSAYRLEQGDSAMTVSFEVEADSRHLPVALASMTAKYAREMLMHRFNGWFCERIPGLKPTAGYATDGKRFIQDLQPHFSTLGIGEEDLVRQR